jgi:hypothetical protein
MASSDWRWWYCTKENRLYELSDHQVFFRSLRGSLARRSRRHSQSYDNPRCYEGNLPTVIPVSTYIHDNAIVLESTPTTIVRQQSVSTQEIWSDAIRQSIIGTLDTLEEGYRHDKLMYSRYSASSRLTM